MEETQEIQKIMEQLRDHEARIAALEGIRPAAAGPTLPASTPTKQLTLAEIARQRNFKGGGEKVAVVVGYYEKVLGRDPVLKSDLTEGWKQGKFDGKYDSNFLKRAIKAGLVREIGKGLDLSQTGERFFEEFLKENTGSA